MYIINIFLFYILNIEKDQAVFVLLRTSITFLLYFLTKVAFLLYFERGGRNEGQIAIISLFMFAVIISMLLFWIDSSPFEVLEQYFTGKFRSVEGIWRNLYHLREFQFGIDTGANFRNGIVAILFAVSCIAASRASIFTKFVIVVLNLFMSLILLSNSGVMLSALLLLLLVQAPLVKYSNAILIVFCAAIALCVTAILGVSVAGHFIGSEEGLIVGESGYLHFRITQGFFSRIEQSIIAYNDIVASGYMGQYVGYQITDNNNNLVYPHNMFLSVWLNAGLIGFLLYLTMYLRLFWEAISGIFGVNKNTQFSMNQFASSLALTVVLVRALLSGNIEALFDYGSVLAIAYYSAVMVYNRANSAQEVLAAK